MIKIKGINNVISITGSIREGSTLALIEALKNIVESGKIPLLDAVKLITINPVRLLGLDKRIGSIKPGMDADLVLSDKSFDVKMTIVRGEVICRKLG